MSAGLSFGALPAFADLTPDQQALVMQAIQGQGQPANAPPAAPSSLLGQADPQVTGAIPDRGGPQVAMTEADARRMEQAMASPQDRAALGSVPGSPDQLLFDRAGMGAGANPFSGSAGGAIPQADAMGARPMPMPPQRPSDADLAALPATTGALPPPGVPQRQAVASSAYQPDAPAVGPRSAGMPPSGRFSDPSRATTSATGDFDPLTGQVTSGQPRPLGAPQGAVSPSGAAAATGASSGLGPGSVLEKFAQGASAGNPDLSNLLLHVGLGLMSERGFGPGLRAGIQGYQSAQAGSVKNLLEQVKLSQQLQGQQATYGSLRKAGYSHEQATAGMYNPTMLSNLLQQQNQKPNTIDKDGVRYLVPPNAANDPSQWQRIGLVNGPQPGFEADPNNPTGQRPITGSVADPNYKATVASAEAKAKIDATPSKPILARPGTIVLDGDTHQPIYTAPSAKPDNFDTETKLRGEFSKQLGTFSDVHDGYNRIISATKVRQDDPNAVSPASDMGLIFGFMKMLDPSSVVREGEYETARKTAGVPDRVWSAYEKLRNGQILTDGQRQDFLGQATSIYNGARKTAQGVAERYRDLATKYGVDPDRATYLPEAPTPPKFGQQAQDRPSKTVDPAARYQQLRQGGLSAADAHARMSQEGF